MTFAPAVTRSHLQFRRSKPDTAFAVQGSQPIPASAPSLPHVWSRFCSEMTASAVPALPHQNRKIIHRAAFAAPHLRPKPRRCGYTRRQLLNSSSNSKFDPLITWNPPEAPRTSSNHTNQPQNITRTCSRAQITSNNAKITNHVPFQTWWHLELWTSSFDAETNQITTDWP